MLSDQALRIGRTSESRLFLSTARRVEGSGILLVDLEGQCSPGPSWFINLTKGADRDKGINYLTLESCHRGSTEKNFFWTNPYVLSRAIYLNSAPKVYLPEGQFRPKVWCTVYKNLKVGKDLGAVFLLQTNSGFKINSASPTPLTAWSPPWPA